MILFFLYIHLKFQLLPHLLVSINLWPSPSCHSSNILRKELPLEEGFLSIRLHDFPFALCVSLTMASHPFSNQGYYLYWSVSWQVGATPKLWREWKTISEEVSYYQNQSWRDTMKRRQQKLEKKKNSVKKAALRKVLETEKGSHEQNVPAKERSWNSDFSVLLISSQETH